MSPETASSWWHRATPAQRLAQIDGGIECGMTVNQVALASGIGRGALMNFAVRNERSFPKRGSTHALRRSGGIRTDRAAYLRGDHVDFWGNGEPAEGVFA